MVAATSAFLKVPGRKGRRFESEIVQVSYRNNSFALRTALLSVAVALVGVDSVSAEEYASAAGALESFDAAARAAICPQLKAWLMLLQGTFAGSLFLVWKHPLARWAFGGLVFAMTAGKAFFTAVGWPMLGGAISIWHIVC